MRVIWEYTEGNHVWLIIFCAMNSYYKDLVPVQLRTLNCVLISVVGFYGVGSLADWNMLQHVGWYSWYNLTHPLWKIVLEFKWGKLIYRKQHAFFLCSDFKKQYVSNLSNLLPFHCLPGTHFKSWKGYKPQVKIIVLTYDIFDFFHKWDLFPHSLFALWLCFLLLKSWCNGMGCLCVKLASKIVLL